MAQTPKTRLVLARRLARLMDSTPALDTQVKLATASGLAQSTIGRILRADVAVSIDNLEAIADAFGLEVRDLLHEKQIESEDVGGTPTYDSLPDQERAKINSFIAWTVAEYAKAHDGRLSFVEERRVAPHERAAIARGSARFAQPQQKQESTQEHEKERSEAAPRRRRGRPRKVSW